MARFDSFVVFADMRTGSNFLERNLNLMNGITCHGELFNPYFIAAEGQDSYYDVDLKQREENPAQLLKSIQKHSQDIPGFRYFNDHDPRVFDAVVKDAKCAKVLLTRNPLDSYVSYKIAMETNQWVLTDVAGRVDGKATFDPVEFDAFAARTHAFRRRVQQAVQQAGQALFHIEYDDIGDLAMLQGLGKFLGAKGKLRAVSDELKKQNPAPLSQKVSNFEQMMDHLHAVYPFAGTAGYKTTPDRGAAVRSYVAGADDMLLFMPMGGGPEQSVIDWLRQISAGKVTRGFDQKSIRRWKRQNPGHRSFTVVTHPLGRAHTVFCERIVGFGPNSYPVIRDSLRDLYAVNTPADEAGLAAYTLDDHRQAFLAFLKFVGLNLKSQTTIRIDRTWAAQGAVLRGFGEFASPDVVMRAEDLTTELPDLARRVGVQGTATIPDVPADEPFALSQFYDGEIEKAAREVYQRDFMLFGYGAWSAAGRA